MKESCFCGWVGELEDRMPVLHDDGYEVLQCPECGHLDRMEWLPEDARLPVLEKAHNRKIGQLTAV